MSFGDILILAVIAACVVLALRAYRKNGKCGGDCANCGRNCKRK